LGLRWRPHDGSTPAAADRVGGDRKKQAGDMFQDLQSKLQNRVQGFNADLKDGATR
jgi:hypothetical protein